MPERCLKYDAAWHPEQGLSEAFLNVPRRVYADDPYWLLEDEAEVRFLFSPEHDYFRYARATVATEREEARLAGFFDPRLQIEGAPAAFFGFWETRDDPGANRALFDHVEAWTRAQGARMLYGPINFNTFRPYRLRTAAPEGSGCFSGEPYNPPYYPALLEGLGYEPVAHYLTQASSRPYSTLAREMIDARLSALGPLPAGLRLQPLTPDFWLEHLPHFYRLVDVIFGQNFAYRRPTYEAFRTTCGEGFARRFCPRTSLVATTARGDIAGFFLTFPDYAPLLRQGNPDRLRLRDVRYVVHFPQLQRPVFLAKTLGVHPDYRQQGLLTRMSTEALQRSLPHYEDGLICLMKADNPSTRFGLPFIDQCRTYALYGKRLV